MSDDPTFATALAGTGALMDDALAEIARLREALSEAQEALVLVTDPDRRTATTVVNAWATCVAAEQKARVTLEGTAA